MYHRLAYATPDDLPESLQNIADIEDRLQAASDIITWMLSNARYAVDEEGYPTDTKLLLLLKEATIKQVIFADDKYGGVDVEEDEAPVALGSLRFGAPSSTRNPNWGTGIRQNVAPSVWYMLFNAGLIRGKV